MANTSQFGCQAYRLIMRSADALGFHEREIAMTRIAATSGSVATLDTIFSTVVASCAEYRAGARQGSLPGRLAPVRAAMSHQPSHSTEHLNPPHGQAEEAIRWDLVVGVGVGAIILFTVATLIAWRFMVHREFELQARNPAQTAVSLAMSWPVEWTWRVGKPMTFAGSRTQ